MFIELVDALRCPAPHEETWLVASVARFDGRDIVEGFLGCPVCRRQFPVRDGEADFTEAAALNAAVSVEERGGTPARVSAVSSPPGMPDESSLLRARALLGLDEGGGVVLLGGAHAAWAPALEDAAQVTTLLLNAPREVGTGAQCPSAIRAVDAVPLAAGTLRAAWLDEATASPASLAAAARALRPGGRLVAPAHAAVPAGARELARDAQEWVAEWGGSASAPVGLRRR